MGGPDRAFPLPRLPIPWYRDGNRGMVVDMNFFRNMNGYQRIGVLAGVVWIMLHVGTVISVPAERSRALDAMDREAIAKAVLNASKDAKKEYAYEFSLINSFDHLDLDRFVSTMKEKFPDTKGEIDKVTSAAFWSRIADKAVTVGIMLVPPVCFFVIGSLLGWAVAGFKKAK